MRPLVLSLLFLVCVVGKVDAGFGDFLNDIIKEPKGESKKQGESKGVVDGLGGMFGVNSKSLGLIKGGLKIAQAMQPIAEQEELAIGGAIAVEAFARFGGEYKNKRLLTYINLVGEAIVEVSDRPDLDFHFALLNSNGQNAFAAPGGYIFITKGLLFSLKNEAELAGVLSHEIAHVTKKHMLKTLQRSKLLASTSELTLSAMNQNPQMFANVINEMSSLLFDKGLDKELEFDADRFGLEYAYMAGYNPVGLRDFLKTLQQNEGKADSRFFSTHPSTKERVAKCNILLQEVENFSGLPLLQSRFKKEINP